MVNLMDNQWGMALEGTYNTPVTVTRFYTWLDDVNSNWDIRRRDPAGLFPASNRTRRMDRVFLPIGQGTVVVKTELASRQGALLANAAMGVSTLTAITGGSQIMLTPGITGTVLPSYTIQVVKVLNNGSQSAETYAGCTAVSAEIEVPDDGIATIMVTFDARSYTTATAIATFAITAGAFLFDASNGAAGLFGTLTAPTTTTLATGLTAYANVKTWKLAWDNTADTARWVLGGRNQPTIGELKPVLTATVEFNDTIVQAAYLGLTAMPFTATHTTAEVLSTGNSQFQCVIPASYLDTGIPEAVETTATQDIQATVKYGTAGLPPFYLIWRTADTVL